MRLQFGRKASMASMQCIVVVDAGQPVVLEVHEDGFDVVDPCLDDLEVGWLGRLFLHLLAGRELEDSPLGEGDVELLLGGLLQLFVLLFKPFGCLFHLHLVIFA